MAEAEDLLSDVARHGFIWARALWQKRPGAPIAEDPVRMADLAGRIQPLLTAVFGTVFPLRVAQLPPAPTLLARILARDAVPRSMQALPATDGLALWLPADLGTTDSGLALQLYRVMALQQAMRAVRGGARLLAETSPPPRVEAVFLLLECAMADIELLRRLPGLGGALNELRRSCLAQRPALEAVPPFHRDIEELASRLLRADSGELPIQSAPTANPAASLDLAVRLVRAMRLPDYRYRSGESAVFLDHWTGEFLDVAADVDPGPSQSADSGERPHSAALGRRPRVRRPGEDEEDDRQGAWMVQASPPLEHAEDPMGLQRPEDLDDKTPPDELADSVSELPEARLVTTPGRPREVLLSDDPPLSRSGLSPPRPGDGEHFVCYPEWDWRKESYRDPGTRVHLRIPNEGSRAWVEAVLQRHRLMLEQIRRRFEMLRPEQHWLRRQVDGEEIDLGACVAAWCDRKAGLAMSQRLYSMRRPERRNMAIMLLIDVSGSTDTPISAQRRIIDVEREALLLVCEVLHAMGERYSIQAYSGEGPLGVTVSTLKDFDQPYDGTVALRVAALEPERYTRSGAALRHATSRLMREQARHRLLLLLSDGKPNDADEYEGRYGAEDTRMAVCEARAQGVFPFCLTIDRQAAEYLPATFGPGRYALLPRPERLPHVLLEWLRRLISN